MTLGNLWGIFTRILVLVRQLVFHMWSSCGALCCWRNTYFRTFVWQNCLKDLMELTAVYMYLIIRKAGLTMFMYDDFIHKPATFSFSVLFVVSIWLIMNLEMLQVTDLSFRKCQVTDLYIGFSRTSFLTSL
jgi:hypothetical protein